MTLDPSVNPKKLKPYDEPRPRRRSLIPDEPGSAATAFLVVGVLWLALATALGLFAIASRAIPGLSLELNLPLGIFGLEFGLNADRLNYAFYNAVAYGWLTNAGIGAAFFIVPRLIGRPLASEKLAMLGLGILNLSIAFGVTSLYFVDLPAVSPLVAFPALIDAGMLLGLLFAAMVLVGTLGGPTLRDRYVSTWYLAVALPALLAFTEANAAIGLVSLPPTTAALASAFIQRGIETYWLFGVAVATLYYVVPRASGNPLYSSGLAMLGWITWLLLAGLSALGTLVDTSVPYAITTLGNVATILMIVPAFLVVANLALTVRGKWSLVLGSGTLPFALVSLAFLLGTGVLEAIGALRSVEALVGATEWLNGIFVYAALGAYSFAMYAVAEHALPRLLRRQWGGGFMSGVQLWAGFGGAVIAALALMAAGLAEGSLIAQATDPQEVAFTLLPFRAAAAAGLGLVALGGLALLGNLFLMYTSARPSDYVLPTATVPAGN